MYQEINKALYKTIEKHHYQVSTEEFIQVTEAFLKSLFLEIKFWSCEIKSRL